MGPGIHETAVISEKALIGKDVTIMAYAVIEEGAEIGDGCVIYPYCYIGKYASSAKTAN